MKDEPLVTIGIPSYNRPMGLKKTLIAITNQTYKNIEIIVSDNGSPSNETETIVLEFAAQDKRIHFFKQPSNKGIFFNFYFVLEQAKGDYYMWAADDDEWQGTEFLSTLMKYAPHNILTFPEALIKDKNNIPQPILEAYEHCKTQIDYSKTFCTHGWGHPLYGIFNLKLFYQYGLEFKFAEDLSYNMEGEFLHKAFLAGPTKYVKNAQILYDTNSTKPSWDNRIDIWTTYFKRTLLIYSNSNLTKEIKSELISIILTNYSSYSRSLFEKFVSYKPIKINITDKTLKTPNNFYSKLLLRLKLTLKVLIKGYC